MAATNTQGTFSLGRDCTLVLVDGSFGEIQFDNVTGFNCRQVTKQVRVDRLDGVQLNADIPKGWSGQFMLERANVRMDDYFSKKEDAWFSGGKLTTATVYQYIAEADGSTTTLQYDNVALTFTEAGNWQGDQAVKLSVAFTANRRRRI